MAVVAGEMETSDAATRWRRIKCPCGGYLLEGDVPLGHELQLALAPCPRCRRFPVLFIDIEGRYVVVPYGSRPQSNTIIRPEVGWR